MTTESSAMFTAKLLLDEIQLTCIKNLTKNLNCLNVPR